MNDEWIDRALRELGEHLLDRDIPERLSRVLKIEPPDKEEECERKR